MVAATVISTSFIHRHAKHSKAPIFAVSMTYSRTQVITAAG